MSKKTLNSVFEIFRIRDKDVPIEVLEFNKDMQIMAFAWECKGIRFGIIHSEGQSNRTDVSFYSMGSKYNGKISLIKTLEKKAATLLFWSPAGSIVLMANLKGTSGQLEWVDVNAMQTIGEAEHFMCSDIEWDPTGRFVATSVSHWRHQMEMKPLSVLSWVSMETSYQRRWIISERCVRVKKDKANQASRCGIKAVFSIVSFLTLCSKEEILHKAMVWVEKVSMVRNLKMKTLSWPMKVQERCPWPTPDRIPMVRSFSFAQSKHLGWMESTLCLVA